MERSVIRVFGLSFPGFRYASSGLRLLGVSPVALDGISEMAGYTVANPPYRTIDRGRLKGVPVSAQLAAPR